MDTYPKRKNIRNELLENFFLYCISLEGKGMKEFTTNPDISYIITVCGFIFGLIGVIAAFFGIKSYFDQKKTDKAYEVLLKKANIEWNGKYTEDEVKRLNDELNIITEQISKEIPLQAKKVLMESKVENIEQELRKLCKEHKYLKKELEKIHPVDELDKNIKTYIQEEVNMDKPKKRFIISVSLFLLIFVFLSSPIIQIYYYRLLNNVINITKARLYVEHITTYIMAMIAVTGLYLIIPIKILNFKYNKILYILIVISLFIIWGILIYLISFNILIVNYIAQFIVALISLGIFAVAFKMVVILVKKSVIR